MVLEVAIIASCIAVVAAFVAPLFQEPTPRCWNGWLYDGMHGRQVFNEQGGGIPCTVKEK